MTAKSYLMINSEQQQLDLFVGYANLPLFWLGMLDETILANTIKAWQTYDCLCAEGNELELERFTDVVPNPTWLTIEAEAFRTNMDVMAAYIRHYHLKYALLFEEFYQYLESCFKSEDDCIMLDIIGYSDDYEQSADLLEDIRQAIKGIRELKQDSWPFNRLKPISTGTGFSLDGLAEPQYLLYAKQDQRKTFAVNKTEFRVKKLCWLLLILLLCPVFTAITYRGYSLEGFSFNVFFVGICNLGFYIFSLWGIRDQWQLYQQHKANNK